MESRPSGRIAAINCQVEKPMMSGRGNSCDELKHAQKKLTAFAPAESNPCPTESFSEQLSKFCLRHFTAHSVQTTLNETPLSGYHFQ